VLRVRGGIDVKHWGVFESAVGIIVHAVIKLRAPRPENKPGSRGLTACRFRFIDEELRDKNPGEELARGARLCRRCLFALRLDEAPVRLELARAAPWEASPKPKPALPPPSTRLKINVLPPPKHDRPPPGPEGVVRKRMAWPDKLGGK
jgi:hypothetical protein